MSNNNESGSINFNPYFIFCIAFTIVGVWFPDYFMWVVWAFAAYLALNILLILVLVICIAVVVLFLRHLAKSGD